MNWLGVDLNFCTGGERISQNDSERSAIHLLDAVESQLLQSEELYGLFGMQSTCEIELPIAQSGELVVEPKPQVAEPNEVVVERRVVREGGGFKALNITLVWDDPSDLDLSVLCPSGTTINYKNKRACEGELR